jgi:hypothetical protein
MDFFPHVQALGYPVLRLFWLYAVIDSTVYGSFESQRLLVPHTIFPRILTPG